MNDKKYIKPALILLAMIAAFIIAVAVFSRLERFLARKPAGADTSPTLAAAQAEDGVSPLNDDSEPVILIQHGGKTYRYNSDLSVLLIIGVDDYGLTEYRDYQNNSQADFLLVSVFDPADRSVTLLQLNRDTMTNVPLPDGNGGFYGFALEQIALAHSYGSGLEDSCENTEYAVSQLLYSLPIDNYFAVTMDVIPILNDLVGGVTVTVEDSFAGIDDSLVLGSTVTLFGSQAETFVRARRSMPDDASNIARMRRQRTYMTALVQQLKNAASEDDAFVLDAYNAIADYLVTDCSVDALYDYASLLSGYTLEEIITPEGESIQGEIYKEFYVDEQALQQLVVDLFYLPVVE